MSVVVIPATVCMQSVLCLMFSVLICLGLEITGSELQGGLT